MSWHIAETREQARAEAREGLLRHLNEYITATLPRPGACPYKTADEAVDKTAFVPGAVATIGTPDDLVERIKSVLEISGGFGTVVGFVHDWANPENTRRSWDMVARYVVPEINGYLAGLRTSREFVASNREYFNRAREAVMAKITENPAAAARPHRHEVTVAGRVGRQRAGSEPGPRRHCTALTRLASRGTIWRLSPYSRRDDDRTSRSLVLAALGRVCGRGRAARRGGRLFDGGRGRQPVGVSRDVRDDGAVRASDATGAHRAQRDERDHPPPGGRRVGHRNRRRDRAGPRVLRHRLRRQRDSESGRAAVHACRSARLHRDGPRAPHQGRDGMARPRGAPHVGEARDSDLSLGRGAAHARARRRDRGRGDRERRPRARAREGRGGPRTRGRATRRP